MYQLVGYYKGPEEKKPRFGIGRTRWVCVVDIQLYRIGSSISLENLGIYEVEVSRGKNPYNLRSVLEQRLRAVVRERGVGVRYRDLSQDELEVVIQQDSP